MYVNITNVSPTFSVTSVPSSGRTLMPGLKPITSYYLQGSTVCSSSAVNVTYI
jgi:hypothetical protein